MEGGCQQWMVAQAAWFLWRVGRTSAALARLPYLVTRHTQLTFRFFLLQSVLAVVALLLQFIITFARIINKYSDEDFQSKNLPAVMASLLYTPTQLIGRDLFVSIFVLILMMVHLPPKERPERLRGRVRWVQNEDQWRALLLSSQGSSSILGGPAGGGGGGGGGGG
eukprot:CAMPEP_0206367010 /NCGR_PEP_ID=MMETSP0294-20121207/3791_1 /ASSEMBLY_ACC=CAM_ASM_000327 /TAXON_ID=39354 /ORGANISM="Heterosigma akashiwo, Strain CCMP2393" /LENGTH=165 /DNA_ID=CAMNT_0053813181 /DNA_START=377 /DNA_END=871 /DNA_ORIENTATION=+